MKILDYLNIGHERTVKLKKNVFYSLIIKGLNVLINLLLVPITLDYLDVNAYGVWLTLSSIVMWFSFFDIGLGNGLRNKLAEAIAINDQKSGQILVSTAYAFIVVIVLIISIATILVNPLINWNRVLNTNDIPDLENLVLFVFLIFFARLISQLIISVLRADQRNALADGLMLSGNVVSLVIIYFLNNAELSSIFYLALVMLIPQVLIMIISSFILFNQSYKYLTPEFNSVNLKYVKSLANLGIKFFIIQIAGVFIFSANNVIVAQLFNPSAVTKYNIAYKYFSIVFIIFTTFNSPLWSAYTDAYVKEDINWINTIIKKLQKLWILCTIILVVMLIISNSIYVLWLGDNITIPFSLSLLMCIYFIVLIGGSIYVNLINGTSKLTVQLWFSIIAGLINIPLTIFIIGYFDGDIAYVMISNILIAILSLVILSRQYKKIIMKKAIGVWNA